MTKEEIYEASKLSYKSANYLADLLDKIGQKYLLRMIDQEIVLEDGDVITLMQYWIEIR